MGSLNKEASILERYCDLLLEWNKTHNLTGAKTKDEVWQNINDSLGVIEFLPEFESACDVGSGAGFPGLILAIALPKAHFTLIEPINKKASFLKFCSVDLGLKNVKVEARRAEQVSESFDIVFSRAVAETKELLWLCSHLCKDDGSFLFFKGESVQNELANIKKYEIFEKEKRKYLMIRKRDAI